MRISRFFIDRPIFASVVSIIIVILGGVVWSALLSTNLLPALYLHRRLRARTGSPA